MAADDNLLTPGTPTPASGQYEVVGPRGGKRDGLEITSTKGKPLPPTKETGTRYRLNDKTKHKKQAKLEYNATTKKASKFTSR